CKVKLRETNVPSQKPDADKTPGCPCSYSDLKSMINSMREAEYVLEDVQLHLKRTRKLEKSVANMLNSMSRMLHVVRLPM
ncbi:hypothetical protein CRM22_010038, partial [Opisthorchis felineus]